MTGHKEKCFCLMCLEALHRIEMSVVARREAIEAIAVPAVLAAGSYLVFRKMQEEKEE